MRRDDKDVQRVFSTQQQIGGMYLEREQDVVFIVFEVLKLHSAKAKVSYKASKHNVQTAHIHQCGKVMITRDDMTEHYELEFNL